VVAQLEGVAVVANDEIEQAARPAAAGPVVSAARWARRTAVLVRRSFRVSYLITFTLFDAFPARF